MIIQRITQPWFGDMIDRTSQQSRGLVAFWPLNDGAGITARDLGGNSHGTLTNGPAWTGGRSLLFDGINDYVTTPYSVRVTPPVVTFSMVVTLDSSMSGTLAVLGGTGQALSYSSYTFVFRSNRMTFTVGNASSAEATASSYAHAFGKPQRWTGTWDGANLRIYLDGVLQDSQTPAVSIGYNGSPVIIGAYVNGNYPTKGVMSDVRIYNRALSAEEVRAMHVNPNGVYRPRRIIVPSRSPYSPFWLNGAQVRAVKFNGQGIVGARHNGYNVFWP